MMEAATGVAKGYSEIGMASLLLCQGFAFNNAPRKEYAYMRGERKNSSERDSAVSKAHKARKAKKVNSWSDMLT